MANVKKLSMPIYVGVILALVLSSCTQPQPVAVITEPIPLSKISASQTPTLSLASTQSPTFTITSTLTLTPNFSPPIATKTLLPRATCPQPNKNTTLDFTNFENSLNISTADDLEEAMGIAKNSLLTYMNAGGTTDNLGQVFQQELGQPKPNYLGQVQAGEITGDGVSEVFVWIALPSSEEGLPSPLTIYDIKRFFPMPVFGTRTFVFSCNQEKYDLIGTIKDEYYKKTAMPTIADLNADGTGEIVQPSYDFAGSGYAIHVHILNWSGNQLVDSLHGDLMEDWMSSFSEGFLIDNEARVRSGNFSIQDIDSNGTIEVAISSDDLRGAQHCELLYRETKMVLMWNGDHYIGFYWRTPPIYRIQAIWDGDHESVHGLLGQALSSYQNVLDDEKLLPWSLEYNNLVVPLCGNIPGSTSIPTNALPDETEVPRLQAYSLYRIMLLKLVLGDFSSAEETYKTLQKKYQNAYQELAKLFWDKYSITKNIGKACQTVVTYAEVNQARILHPLDRYTYGNPDSLMLAYQPEDICPYK